MIPQPRHVGPPAETLARWGGEALRLMRADPAAAGASVLVAGLGGVVALQILIAAAAGAAPIEDARLRLCLLWPAYLLASVIASGATIALAITRAARADGRIAPTFAAAWAAALRATAPGSLVLAVTPVALFGMTVLPSPTAPAPLEATAAVVVLAATVQFAAALAARSLLGGLIALPSVVLLGISGGPARRLQAAAVAANPWISWVVDHHPEDGPKAAPPPLRFLATSLTMGLLLLPPLGLVMASLTGFAAYAAWRDIVLGVRGPAAPPRAAAVGAV